MDELKRREMWKTYTVTENDEERLREEGVREKRGAERVRKKKGRERDEQEKHREGSSQRGGGKSKGGGNY